MLRLSPFRDWKPAEVNRKLPFYKGVQTLKEPEREVTVIEFDGTFAPSPDVQVVVKPWMIITQQAEPPKERPPGLWNTEQAAEFLSISPETLRRLCRKKLITFILITPSEYRFAKDDLIEYADIRRNMRKSVIKK